MARQLIVCCDGTNNNMTGRRNDTNVAQLCELLSPDANDQMLYYDPGVGNVGGLPGATLIEQIKSRAERIAGLAFGTGIYENIAEAYRFLMRNWRVGDDIYLYGFSRGAFTVRSVGGLVTQFGILRPEMDVMVPTLLNLYFLSPKARKQNFDLIKTQISQLFAGAEARQAAVHFVGVWDTVASVGAPVPFLKKEITAAPTIVGKRFTHVRQALALDEHRTTFKPRLYDIEEKSKYRAEQSIEQVWFSGSHCDVGGGYENGQAGLSQQTLLWMMQQSAQCGLRLKPELLAAADGTPDEEKIVQLLDANSNQHAVRQIMVHSEAYETPWWALGGLSVRDAAGGAAPPVQAPSVASNQLVFPAGTDWKVRRPKGPLVFAAFAVFVLWVIQGALLYGLPTPPGHNVFYHAYSALKTLPEAVRANNAFAWWQLTWFWPLHWPVLEPSFILGTFIKPATAVLVDFFMIPAYGYLLARAVSWAFAKLAKLRTTASTVSKILNLLGYAALVMILGDIAENIFTWLVLWTQQSVLVPNAETVFGVLMTLAALAKWLGFAGSAALVGWACVAKK
jgi:Uncharacterized alpha/beta hydrolase domain (DUF2235)